MTGTRCHRQYGQPKFDLGYGEFTCYRVSVDGRALFRLRARLELTQAQLAEVFYCDHTAVWEHEHEANFEMSASRRPSVRFRGDVAAALERALTRHSPAAVWPRVDMARVDRVALILTLGAESPEKLRELLQVELLLPPVRRRP